VNGVIEESDGTSEKAADNFSDNQAKSGEHSPTEHGGLQRGMRVTVVLMRLTEILVADSEESQG
jgi:hypothetical protein